MDEYDVMRILSHCIKNECKICEKCGVPDCMRQTMQEANAIMKMQSDALKGFHEETMNLEKEILRLKPLSRYSFDEKELVEAVNSVATSCYCADIESGGEDEENSYIGMLRMLLKLGDMLPSKYKLEIIDIKSAPKLVKR